jgi:TonB family protein
MKHLSFFGRPNLLSAILVQTFAWSQSENVPPDELRFDRGVIANGIYTNGCFGISVSMPEGWTTTSMPGLASGKALHLPGGALGLLTLGRHRENSFGDQIGLQAHDASKYPTLTARNFVSNAAQGHVASDPLKRAMIRDAVAVEYAGRQFFRADYKQAFVNGSTLYAAFVYTKFGDYFIGETVTAMSPEALNEAADSLRRISFLKDSPNPSCVIGPNDGPLTGVIGTVLSSSSGMKGTSRVRVSQGVSQGLLIKSAPPEYPEAARLGHVEGTVVLDTKIDTNGDVEDVAAISGPPLLVPAAMEAVKHWKYKPYLLNGQAAKIETPTLVVFQLPPNN